MESWETLGQLVQNSRQLLLLRVNMFGIPAQMLMITIMQRNTPLKATLWISMMPKRICLASRKLYWITPLDQRLLFLKYTRKCSPP